MNKKRFNRALAELANLGFMLSLDGCMVEEEYELFTKCLDIIQEETKDEEV